MSTSPAISTIKISAACEDLSSKAGVDTAKGGSCEGGSVRLDASTRQRRGLSGDSQATCAGWATGRRRRSSLTRRAVAVRLDLDGVHQRAHQHQPAAALVGRRRGHPVPAVGDLDRGAGRPRRASRSPIAPVVPAIGVLDRVVQRLADREHDFRLGLGEPVPVEPGAQPAPDAGRTSGSAGSSSEISGPDRSPRAAARRRRSERRSPPPRSRAPSRRRCVGVSTHRPGQRVDAVLDALAAALDEPVGVERERRLDRGARCGARRRRRAPRPRAAASSRRRDGRSARSRGRAGAAADAPPQEYASTPSSGSMATQAAVIISSSFDVPDHPPEDLGRELVVVGVGPEDAPLAAHDRRRADAAAAHVADAELEDPVRPEDGVVPVAADLDPLPPARYSPASAIPGLCGSSAGGGSAEAARPDRARARTRARGRGRALPARERAEQLPLARGEPAARA